MDNARRKDVASVIVSYEYTVTEASPTVCGNRHANALIVHSASN